MDLFNSCIANLVIICNNRFDIFWKNGDILKEYLKPCIEDEEINIEDICINSNTGKKVIDDSKGYPIGDGEPL